MVNKGLILRVLRFCLGKMLWWVLSYYCARSGAERCYIAAVFIFFVGMWAHKWQEYTTDVASLVIVFGFVLWCLPWITRLKTAWERPWARVPIILMHLVALLIATVLSRNLVAASLGLPPQTFDLTVGFLIILLYIPAWLIMAAGLAVIIGFSLISIGIAYSLIVSFQHKFVSFVRVFGWGVTHWQKRDSSMMHGVGAFLSSLFLVAGYAYLDENYPVWLSYPVRLLAVKSDFYPVKDYPGFNAGEYIHPLENGMTAFVRPGPWREIKIGIKTQDVLTSPVFR